MRKRCISFLIPLLGALLVLPLAGCDGLLDGLLDGGDSGNDSRYTGTITLTGAPGTLEGIAIYITSGTINNSNYTDLGNTTPCASGSSIGSGNTVSIVWNPLVNSSASYNVQFIIYKLGESAAWGYRNNISFSSGSATVDYSGITFPE